MRLSAQRAVRETTDNSRVIPEHLPPSHPSGTQNTVSDLLWAADTTDRAKRSGCWRGSPEDLARVRCSPPRRHGRDVPDTNLFSTLNEINDRKMCRGRRGRTTRLSTPVSVRETERDGEIDQTDRVTE